MPLSWNEIKSRALAFSRTWADAADEASQAKPFWIGFFEIFGITDKRVATFELAVKKHGGEPFAPTRPRSGALLPEGVPAALGRPGVRWGFVDLFWPGMLLVEYKSRGRDLNRAFDKRWTTFRGCPSATCRNCWWCATLRAFGCTSSPAAKPLNLPWPTCTRT